MSKLWKFDIITVLGPLEVICIFVLAICFFERGPGLKKIQIIILSVNQTSLPIDAFYLCTDQGTSSRETALNMM